MEGEINISTFNVFVEKPTFEVETRPVVFVVESQQNIFDVEVSIVSFNVDLLTTETIGITRILKSYICGESIIDGQVVVFREGKIYRASPFIPDTKKIVGVAIQSGTHGEAIDVLVQGIYKPLIELEQGFLYLGENSFPSNEPPTEGAIIIIGYKMNDAQAVIFDNKEIISID